MLTYICIEFSPCTIIYRLSSAHLFCSTYILCRASQARGVQQAYNGSGGPNRVRYNCIHVESHNDWRLTRASGGSLAWTDTERSSTTDWEPFQHPRQTSLRNGNDRPDALKGSINQVLEEKTYKRGRKMRDGLVAASKFPTSSMLSFAQLWRSDVSTLYMMHVCRSRRDCQRCNINRLLTND